MLAWASNLMNFLFEDEIAMKKKLIVLGQSFLLSLLLIGCCRTSDEVWEDTKSCSRHMHRGLRSLGGKNGDSRAVCSREEFYCVEQTPYETQEPDFIPLADTMRGESFSFADKTSPPPFETPGDPGSSIPGIQHFQDPSTDHHLAAIFRNLHFDYNQYLVKGAVNLAIIHQIANYMRQHPRVSLFIEGHCDERGPEAYNLSLGAKRANAVRELLIQEGVNPNALFTISYGKERPLVWDHHEEAWAQNRRAEFKIYHQ